MTPDLARNPAPVQPDLGSDPSAVRSHGGWSLRGTRTPWLFLAAIVVYCGVALALSMRGPSSVEQDSAYYSSVAERFAAGAGLTSWTDRRGPAPAQSFPQPFVGNTEYPRLLGYLVDWFGTETAPADAAEAGALVSWIALLGCLVLAAMLFAAIGGRSPPPRPQPWIAWAAVIAAAATVLHRENVRPATLPLTDSPSLLLNAAFALCLVRIVTHRIGLSGGDAATTLRSTPWHLWIAAAILLVTACFVRHQNLALWLPFAATLRPTKSHRSWGVILAICALAGPIAIAPDTAWSGLRLVFDFTHRDSLPRGLRWLAIPVALGVFTWTKNRRLEPLAWIAFSHIVILLAHPDSNDSRPFFFAQRHAMPVHLFAGAAAVACIARGSAAIRAIAAIALLAAFAENIRRPAKAWAKQESQVVTGPLARADLNAALEFLDQADLPRDRTIILSQDSDVFTWRRGLKTLHLRGFDPDPQGPAIPAFIQHLEDRGVTHALLTWQDQRVVERRNARMSAFADLLSPSSKTLADTRKVGSSGRTEGILLLELR